MRGLSQERSDKMAQFTMTPENRAIVEATIGAATFDRLRGEATSLTSVYKAKGGHDPETLKHLSAHDAKFIAANVSKAAQTLAPHGDFKHVAASWSMSADQEALVHRSVGKAVLGKIEGSPVDMSSAYTQLGGNHPDAVKAFQAMDPLFARAQPQSLRS